MHKSHLGFRKEKPKIRQKKKMAMKTIEVCRIEPSSSPTSLTLPLTFFDLFWLRLPPVERLFFYHFPHPPSHFFHSLLPSLKLSLSLSLSHFLPLSGHLSWPLHSPKPLVTYQPGHDAVSLTVAESDADFDLLSGFGFSDAMQCHHLIPHLDSSHDRSSVLALQITLFPNSGFSIAISSHHAVLDGKTSTSFMKSWAYICKNNPKSSKSEISICLPPDLAPSLDRSLIEDPKELGMRYASDWLNHGGPNNRSLEVWNLPLPEGAVRGVFELTRSDIENLKRFVTSKRRHFGRVSTFVVCCAYAWVCRVKAERVRSKSKRLLFAINVDCRGRLEPPLPETYFGNCVGSRMAMVETREILMGEEGDGVVAAVEVMVEALESLKDGVLKGAESWVSKLQGGFGTEDDWVIGGAGTPRFGVYETDFGWGRPKKVEMTSVDRTGAIWFTESRNGGGDGGVEIGLVMKKSVMQEFASLFVKHLQFITQATASDE